jgi:hypothetical protein
MMMLGAGVDQVMIYREAGDGNSLYAASGMLTSQGQPRAPFFTLSTLIRQLNGSGPLYKLHHNNPDVWLYAWVRDGKPTLAAWSTSDAGVLNMDLGSASITDAFGFSQPIAQTNTLQLTELPVYLSDVQHPAVVFDAIEKSKQWYADWKADRQKTAQRKAYLFDMGEAKDVDSFDLGGIRPYTPVDCKEVYTDAKGYGFFPGPGQSNGSIHWIYNKASKDGVTMKGDKEDPSFKFKADPGKYELTIRCTPRGNNEYDAVVEGISGGAVKMRIGRKLPDPSAIITVGKSPVVIKVPSYSFMCFVRLLEVKE